MTTHNLLVELFVEELPPKALKRLGESFAGTLTEALKRQGLLADTSQTTHFASPRRLAAHITDVAARAADQPVRAKLMPVQVALDAQGQATPALLKKLQALGADASVVPQLVRAPDGKSEALFLERVEPGAALAEGLQAALEAAIAKLPIPKVMTYQLSAGTALPGWDSVQFVRPAHGLVALHGEQVVPVTALGLTAGRATHGHRFEAALDPIELPTADSYAAQLRLHGAVIASFEERRAGIAAQLQKAAAQAGEGLRAIEDEALLDEVTALVERPNVLVCQFEEQFLGVPQECLILTMKANQKYFPLLDAQGRLTNRFLVVSNISPADASAVIGGNERVVRPRLADAKFFFDQDRKKPLEGRVEGLAKVVYHNKLGTQGERVERVRAIARAIAGQIAAANPLAGGESLVERADLAAKLAKADLLTDMVGEFPELQGIMGGYYARHDGLPEDVAFAIEDHYKPRFAGDELPQGLVGTVVALADKLETLVGMFGIGNLPTGDKDPFALRRHALGVVRMLREKQLKLPLDILIQDAAREFTNVAGFDVAKATVHLNDFFVDRLAGALREEGFSAAQVDAVLAPPAGHTEAFLGTLDDYSRRLDAVRAFSQLPEAPALAAANKRIGNILKKAEADEAVQAQVDGALLQEPAEQSLYAAMQQTVPQADAQFDAGDYTASLQTLARLREPVDAFFDGVMVNAEDAALRRNRQGLLKTLHLAMNRVADLSRLAQ
ncbi:glycine--tRNA ligase subunit beta [Ottowia sp.]|uniref:glycine--tRNA ligase subunit beta n=2 Tax=Ottowia sp. TaxID=1898956 RepID=UPI002603CEC9|nr:glycine--tRNA ligase subunit beta [Ottowia sp.]